MPFRPRSSRAAPWTTPVPCLSVGSITRHRNRRERVLRYWCTSRMNGCPASLAPSHPGLGDARRDPPHRRTHRLILQIGEWVMRQACQDLKRWQDDYGSAIPHIAVNVSPYQVMAPDFPGTVQRVLETTDTNPANITLEVTENAFLKDGPRALSVLQEVKSLGVGLAIDDFGTGYSSLNYLRRFPFDNLKIDQAFINGLAADDGTYKIVAAIINLAHGLNLTVVVEGIETQQQLTQVADLGSDRPGLSHLPTTPQRRNRTPPTQTTRSRPTHTPPTAP